MTDAGQVPATMRQTNAVATLGVGLRRKLLRLFYLHRYPRYFADVSATWLLPLWLKRVGLSVGRGTRFIGFPIIALAPGSVIAIGPRCSFISRSASTALGVNHPVVLRTLRPGAKLHIGVGARMSGTTICAAKRVVIGDRCVIGANVTIVDTDFHSLHPAARSSPQDASCASARAVKIGNDVFIGGGSYILKGVRIGDGAVVGAGSVVRWSVAPGTIVAGNPARELSTLESLMPGRAETGTDF